MPRVRAVMPGSGEFFGRCGLREVRAEGGTNVYRSGFDRSGSPEIWRIALMKFPSVSLYKETLSKKSQVPAGKTPGKKPKFGMAGEEFWARTDLNLGAKAVLMGIAIHGGGESVVALSQGFIAAACGIERSTVKKGLDALEKHGLLKKSGGEVDQVQPYEVLYPLIVTALRQKTTGAAVTRSHKSTPALVKCLKPSCGTLCRPHKTGWCLKCRKEIELEAKIRRIATAVVAQSA